MPRALHSSISFSLLSGIACGPQVAASNAARQTVICCCCCCSRPGFLLHDSIASSRAKIALRNESFVSLCKNRRFQRTVENRRWRRKEAVRNSPNMSECTLRLVQKRITWWIPSQTYWVSTFYILIALLLTFVESLCQMLFLSLSIHQAFLLKLAPSQKKKCVYKWIWKKLKLEKNERNACGISTYFSVRPPTTAAAAAARSFMLHSWQPTCYGEKCKGWQIETVSI